MPISTSNKPRVTVLGSGVVGLTAALELAKTYDVTIVARNMPGDPPSLGWASPWAGAMWFGVDGSTPAQKKMQRASFDKFWKMAETMPESSAKRIDVFDFQNKTDISGESGLWYNFMPNFRYLEASELRLGAGSGMFYTSCVITPDTYLPWLQAQCVEAGVRFIRQEVTSLRQAAQFVPCEVIVNASGNGAKFLVDVNDETCHMVRGQVMLVKCAAPAIHISHGKHWSEYTYVLPRGDGTAIIGGIKEFDDVEPAPKEWLRKSIHERCRKLLPEYIPEKFEDLEIVRDQVGFRPEREDSVRVERELLPSGQKAVHAYGAFFIVFSCARWLIGEGLTGGGYVYSWGMAAEVARLVDASL
ncbi:hypothetical protein BCR39DRAFT_153271 [Naematelia encephala]|uniref:FAD dependent oxidoreductase domain-containing protein n=1 Tax=Naematelia encephala TaxID=71784 RepID=A0A1Y2B639_9TREE|nr:hypothetical protein BCR39DRAFT_153271 [Naematelia encephala]